MRVIAIGPEFAAWREVARECLREGWLPEQLDLQDATAAGSLGLGLASDGAPLGCGVVRPHVPREFLEAGEVVAVHRSGARWNLLYRLLYRLQRERGLMAVEVDDDVAQMLRMRAQVMRDLHKMHAFVRFRKVLADGEEHYVAWYRPDHRVLRMAAPFFAERFAVMQWTIVTPDESVTHDAGTRELRFGPGVARESVPGGDELEDLWRTYYSAIFNPARLNAEAMRSEMPVRYWRNLPEVAVLPELMQRAEARVATMVTKQAEKTTAAPFVPAEHKLPVLVEAMPGCKGCDLYKHATQVVPGAGTSRAHLMLVGEQPGNEEDKQGEPFVGPAGGVLRRAMDELHIKPAEVYVTNAVKHFKFMERGKRRIHAKPSGTEISACRPWLEAELVAVEPELIVCLGATAAQTLMGREFRITRERGMFFPHRWAKELVATIHPSAILRAQDRLEEEYGLFVRDLKAVAARIRELELAG